MILSAVKGVKKTMLRLFNSHLVGGIENDFRNVREDKILLHFYCMHNVELN